MSAKTLNRILLVEDEPDIQTIVRLSLETIGGFTLHIAGDGPAGLKALETFAPDLLLLDVMLPGMDGLAVFKALKASPANAGLPVVFMTARFHAREAAEYRQLGALDAIAKPFDPMTLPGVIRAIWARHHA